METIRQLPTDRSGLYAFEVTGKIGKADIEGMAAILSAAFEREEEVDILLTMPGYDGVELGAVFDAQALSAQAKSVKHVNRYAVVGAPAWASAMINALDPFSPVEAKTFDIEQEVEAWAWVGGAPAGQR